MVVRRAAQGWLALLILVLTSATLLPGWVLPASATAFEGARASTATTVAVSVYDGWTQHASPHPGSGVTAAVTADVQDRSSTSAAGLRVVAASRIAAEAGRAAEEVGAGWRVGDDVYAATKAGNSPAWSTVRGRFWKNTSADPKLAGQWDDANLARMQSELAPQRFNPDLGGMESMELSHEPIPFRDGGTDVVPRWPQDHAAVDPFRFPGY